MNSIILGAITGDIVGSVYEFDNYRHKDCVLYEKGAFATDDSIMTLAVAKALTEYNDLSGLSDLCVKNMQGFGRKYPGRGYGGNFLYWINSDNPKPYRSYGNGAAMRISPVGAAAKTIEECRTLSEAVTAVTHNHPEGLKGAEAAAVTIYLAKTGASKPEIRKYIESNYYPLDFTCDGIRATYCFNETCQDTVPQALEAFLESTDFEDCLRLSVSIGGDTDTLCAISCACAAAYYGLPEEFERKSMEYLDGNLIGVLEEFDVKFPESR